MDFAFAVYTVLRQSNSFCRYGEDPYLVGTFGTKYVRTMEELDENGFIKVATTIKHFVYGQSSGGVNTASIEAGINHIFNSLGAPYIMVIRAANPSSLMTSYASVDRIPMAANEWMLQEVLKKKMGFNGVIMSDALAIPWLHTQSLVASSVPEAGLLALKAGLDLELSPLQPAVFPTLKDVVNNTDVGNMINAAALNILKLKFATGAFDRPLPSLEHLDSTIRSSRHLAINRNMSHESIVLLQNDGLLPLNRSSVGRVALLGPFANIVNPGSYAASFTQNSANSSLHASLASELGPDRVRFLPSVDIVDTSNSSGIADAVAAATSAGLAVLMLGSLSVNTEDPLVSKRTDGEFFAHAELGFPGLQQQLLDAVLDAKVPTILVLSGGQAFALRNSTYRANAILHSFLGGEFTGDSLVDILFGRVNPSGKLPVTLPQDSGAWPINYNYLNSDNFGGAGAFVPSLPQSQWQFPVLSRNVPHPFGFGMSYTTFSISSPVVHISNSTNGDASITLTTSITNTGAKLGKEVVQLYFRKAYTHVVETANKQLIRFEKVELRPGETRGLTFNVSHSELGYYANMKLQIDPGVYVWWLGSSSRAQDLHTFNVTLP